MKVQLFSYIFPIFLLDAYLPLPAVARSPRPDDNPWERVTTPTRQSHSAAVGFYSAGCLDGAVKIPADGNGYHLMRLSRHRFWAHSSLLQFIGSFGEQTKTQLNDAFLVGDTAQARGGPFTKGHASHQIGLDADIWFLTAKEAHISGSPSAGQRENISALSMLNPRGQKYPLRLNPPGVSDLDSRLWNNRNPLRIVLDRNLRLPSSL